MITTVYTAKFGGIVSGTIKTQNTRMVTDESSPMRITVIDIVTYSVSAVAGFLLLMFIVVLLCIAYCFCCMKAKANRRSKRSDMTDVATSNDFTPTCTCNNNKIFIGNALETNIWILLIILLLHAVSY